MSVRMPRHEPIQESHQDNFAMTGTNLITETVNDIEDNIPDQIVNLDRGGGISRNKVSPVLQIDDV